MDPVPYLWNQKEYRWLAAILVLAMLIAAGCAEPAEVGNQQNTGTSPAPEISPTPVKKATATAPTAQERTPTRKPAPTPTPEPTPAPEPVDTAKPVAVPVTAVPIRVTSTPGDYFVLYVNYSLDGERVEYPVLVKPGEEGTTTLAENVLALPQERYRVERYSVSNPGDVDGDGIDDVTELGSPGSMSPVNSAAATRLEDGAVSIADSGAFGSLGSLWNGYHTVKFIVFGLDQGRPGVVFLNADTYKHHEPFAEAIGLKGSPLYENRVRGYLVHGYVEALDRKLFHFHLLDRDIGFDTVARIYTVLSANLPAAGGDLMMWVRNYQVPHIQSELELYRGSRIPLLFNQDVYGHTPLEVLHPGTGYGLLRNMDPDERPHPRDVVIYETLPNNLPRVAGVITTVPQTPLSHVNLRAVQNDIPNAYIRGVLDDARVRGLLGGYVHYEVLGGGGYGNGGEYSLRAATKAEVDTHFEESRPAQVQIPERDLSVTEIAPLDDIGFEDWRAFGVKAANVAELAKLGFPAGTVPDGFAVPFHFYDRFMEHNGFYERVRTMLADPGFQTDLNVQRDTLRKLRKDIEAADVPAWIVRAIETMNEGFPEGINRRYRSSTNNEDLPGFNGAGLYDSKSQKPSEDREDLAKSLKQVYASLWNFRAFIERDFHRIDHLTAAMGVLVHPSYRNEIANGVASSFDPTPGAGDGTYYVNSQLGEDLVTNPQAGSLPEELRLGPGLGGGRNFEVIETSSLLRPGTLLMTGAQIEQLRTHLAVVHDHFRGLYGVTDGEQFAMEIEFKITSADVLAIKQARPWVFPAR